MLSLQNKPAILEAVDGWYWHQCACGNYVDVNWIPGESDPILALEWADDRFLSSSCPFCILSAAPTSEGPRLRALYQHVQEVRTEVGLGTNQPGPMVRRALGGHWGSQTLTFRKWHAPKHRGIKQPESPYIEQFTLTGGISHTAGDYPDAIDFAEFPIFELTPVSPSFTAVTVYLAENFRHPQVPDAEIRFRWNPLASGIAEHPIFCGWHRINHQDRRLLWSAAERLYSARQAGGRPSLVEQSDEIRKQLIDHADQWTATHRRGPRNIDEFADFCCMGKTTLNEHLDAATLAPWSNFRRRYLSDVGHSRTLRVSRH